MDVQALVEAENAVSIELIVESLRSPTGIIPFVGAGMSHDYGAPIWDDFLELAASSDDEKARVNRLIDEGRYEDAAQVLDTGPHRNHFRALVREKLEC